MKIAIAIAVLFLATTFVVGQEQTQPAPAVSAATQDEVSALRVEIAELRAILIALQTVQPTRQISIGVMPIENAGRIPEVGNSFRQVIVSALNEAGIYAVESLDRETLQWVQRQDQLVRERWIDPVTAPPRGELRGITHFLLATVTRYEEQDREDVKVIAGIFAVRFGGGRMIRTGSLVIDFRLVDARTGEAVDSFRTESSVRRKWKAGAVGGFHLRGGSAEQEWPLPERAARDCAQQAAFRLADLLGLAPAVASPEPETRPAEGKIREEGPRQRRGLPGFCPSNT